MSTSAWAVQHFVDRMFLTWYSPEAIAAATPAGMLNFTIISLFIGTAGYVSTFVAQYHGAGIYERIGPVIWQGLYLAIIAGVVLLLMIPPAGAIFSFAQHGPLIEENQTVYFRILCLGAFPLTASSALAGFFSGRGYPLPVMWINSAATGFNIIFDYLLIFGNHGFPEMGIAGAGYATAGAAFLSFFLYMGLFLSGANNKRFKTRSSWRFQGQLFQRIMRFGFPNGVQFFIDIAGLTMFVFLVGRIGMEYLAATNIAFNINTIAFQPMIGAGMAISVIVGQKLGKDLPDIAERSVWSGFHIIFTYMAAIAALYIFLPDLFLRPYLTGADYDTDTIYEISIVLLRFVAFYSLFDAFTIVFASGIKGAGDTRFVMIVILIFSVFSLVIPSYVAVVLYGAGIYAAWSIATFYIAVLGIIFWLRFIGGKWRKMRVIEVVPPTLPPLFPEIPFYESDK